MSRNERVVLTKMAAELGAETAIIEPDQVTLDAIRAGGGEPAPEALDWHSDEGADYLAVHTFDSAALEPQVAAPHSPGNSGPVGDYEGIEIDQAYIGACVGAKLTDLQMVAEILRGRQVNSRTRLLIAPASQKVIRDATADGTLQILAEAGAYLLPTGCGACAALGAGILAENEVCISSTNRNFKGRMGANSAQVYLGSPYSVAAAAVTGRITDPRGLLA
jgi:3-isopropylmalate/(R)-2-methylmalate dehydratase large subunit